MWKTETKYKIYSLANFRQGTHLWLAERLERDCSVRHKLYNCHCKCFVGGFNSAPESIRIQMLMAINDKIGYRIL